MLHLVSLYIGCTYKFTNYVLEISVPLVFLSTFSAVAFSANVSPSFSLKKINYIHNIAMIRNIILNKLYLELAQTFSHTLLLLTNPKKLYYTKNHISEWNCILVVGVGCPNIFSFVTIDQSQLVIEESIMSFKVSPISFLI